MTTDERKAVHRSANLLRKIPLTHKIRVRIVPESQWNKPDTLAQCKFVGTDKFDTSGYFKIEIRETNFESVHQLLIHEYAHAMVWWHVTTGDHDAEWGLAYARCYQIAMEAATVVGTKLKCQE